MLVLLVEDGPAYGIVVNRILEQSGFETIQADNGIDAYKVVQEVGRTVDLLLTDINMPGLDGISLAERSRQMNPEMSVLLMTGYSALLQPASEYVVVRKPLFPHTLLETIQAVMSSAAQSKCLRLNATHVDCAAH
jgi:CheY-like chemotaxis protein